MDKLYQLGLSQLIAYLEEEVKKNPDKIMRFGFGDPHSYRGFYEDIAFELKENVPVKNMLADAKRALGSTYTGYKGGEYVMGKYTDVYLADYGDTGMSISSFLLELMFRD